MVMNLSVHFDKWYNHLVLLLHRIWLFNIICYNHNAIGDNFCCTLLQLLGRAMKYLIINN